MPQYDFHFHNTVQSAHSIHSLTDKSSSSLLNATIVKYSRSFFHSDSKTILLAAHIESSVSYYRMNLQCREFHQPNHFQEQVYIHGFYESCVVSLLSLHIDLQYIHAFELQISTTLLCQIHSKLLYIPNSTHKIQSSSIKSAQIEFLLQLSPIENLIPQRFPILLPSADAQVHKQEEHHLSLSMKHTPSLNPTSETLRGSAFCFHPTTDELERESVADIEALAEHKL
mmetsp:Transcript_4538/g.7947  ORF Transcript_4538/g.7947 Transcript_4538/m.7947 type:complete len:227 (-) Transcript_4538:630-1310(-)